MPILLGTSGWQYRHWRDTFYPKAVPQARWLEYYADRFAVVESNAAFYRLPERRTFEAWRDRTPHDFVMAVKASRYLTHVKRLKDAEPSIDLVIDRARGLGPKLGPVLLQLPPTFRVDVPRLRDALHPFPTDIRVAVEFRHRSWYTDEVRDLLTSARVALCLADRHGPLTPVWRTADWTYLRLHEGRASPRPCYGRTAMRSWVTRLSAAWRPDEDVYAFFNNDPRACALRDARVFALAARRDGWTVTRIPDASDVRLG